MDHLAWLFLYGLVGALVPVIVVALMYLVLSRAFRKPPGQPW